MGWGDEVAHTPRSQKIQKTLSEYDYSESFLFPHTFLFFYYCKSIKELEASMRSSLEEIIAQLPDVYEEAQFNQQDLFVILQGVTGFFGGIAGKDPFDSIGAALEVAGHFATKCNTGTLQENLDNVEKWLTFGKEYSALEDSSDLDFDKMDVGSVPEVMQVLRHPDLRTFDPLPGVSVKQRKMGIKQLEARELNENNAGNMGTKAVFVIF